MSKTSIGQFKENCVNVLVIADAIGKIVGGGGELSVTVKRSFRNQCWIDCEKIVLLVSVRLDDDYIQMIGEITHNSNHVRLCT